MQELNAGPKVLFKCSILWKICVSAYMLKILVWIGWISDDLTIKEWVAPKSKVNTKACAKRIVDTFTLLLYRGNFCYIRYKFCLVPRCTNFTGIMEFNLRNRASILFSKIIYSYRREFNCMYHFLKLTLVAFVYHYFKKLLS